MLANSGDDGTDNERRLLSSCACMHMRMCGMCTLLPRRLAPGSVSSAACAKVGEESRSLLLGKAQDTLWQGMAERC